MGIYCNDLPTFFRRRHLRAASRFCARRLSCYKSNPIVNNFWQLFTILNADNEGQKWTFGFFRRTNKSSKNIKRLDPSEDYMHWWKLIFIVLLTHKLHTKISKMLKVLVVPHNGNHKIFHRNSLMSESIAIFQPWSCSSVWTF